VTFKSGLQVTQDHTKWYHSKAWVRFPIHLHNYGAILSRLRDIAISRKSQFFIRHLYLAPPKEVTPSEFRENV